jgi:hypothetical protein
MRRLSSTHYRTIGSCLALVVLMLFGLAAPASAADQVPFSASLTGVITGTRHLPGGLVQQDASLSGTATYLGEFTGTGTILIDQHGNFTGTACWVGANGRDRVCFAFSGHLESTHGSCLATVTNTYTVSGGTGKFANATGGGTITRQVDTCAGTYSGTLSGTISQPHSG